MKVWRRVLSAVAFLGGQCAVAIKGAVCSCDWKIA
jgi:hypothetical protein